VNGSYDVPLSDKMVGFLRANYNYRSSVNFSANGDPLTAQRAYGILGGQVGLRSEDGRWSAAVFGRNLLGTRFVTAIGNGGSYQNAWLTSAAIRTIGVLVDFKFGAN
jgi:iron complex outermembrane receptor protein